MDDDLAVAELDDEYDKVYLFGMDLHDEEEAQRVQDALDDVFVRAGVMLVNLPMDVDAGIEVTEADKDDLRELLDYHDVMEGFDG